LGGRRAAISGNLAWCGPASLLAEAGRTLWVSNRSRGGETLEHPVTPSSVGGKAQPALSGWQPWIEHHAHLVARGRLSVRRPAPTRRFISAMYGAHADDAADDAAGAGQSPRRSCRKPCCDGRWHTGHIDDVTSGPADGRNFAEGQEQLPFDAPPGEIDQSWRRRSTARVRQRVRAALDVAADQPARALASTAGYLVRWSVRLVLPLAGATVLLHLFPYHATAGGVHFRVGGTLFTRSGLSADTTFGSWEFRRVDGLPIGAHISPENLDVVKLGAAATQNGQTYADSLRADLAEQIPSIIAWLAAEVVLGLLLGLAAAAAIELAIRYLRGQTWSRAELPRRGRQLGAALGVLVLFGGYGLLSYNPHWERESRVTGTLAALQLFPGQLSQYYTRQAKVFDVISAIAAIQSQLQHNIDRADSLPTSYNVMFISDMHLASTYPLVRQYASNFDVALIVDTGDESEFGTSAEMTPAYLAQLRALTSRTPMIWLAGNHDSPATVRVMRSIPGVIVVGTKIAQPDGAITVAAQQLSVFGLTVGALPDPRVYGGPADYGSNDGDVVHRLERKAVDDAVHDAARTQQFDIFATHEPVAADQLRKDLPGQIRQTNSGHEHAQNSDAKVQHDGRIDLVEGSTGAGGLDNINGAAAAPPIEFSIESVAANCQFTKVVRFQLVGAPPAATNAAPSSGQQVTASTLYLNSQKLDDGRLCTLDEGRTPVQALTASPGG
jgi:predicted MPP superfamily phosphohydrolase